MDSEDPIAATFVHDVEGTESAVDETTPTDSIVPGVEGRTRKLSRTTRLGHSTVTRGQA